jgi:anti-anti-sigma factor
MFTISRNDTYTLVRLPGRFDFKCVKPFQEVLGSGSDWIVDFDDVEYVDSAGLGLLLLLREHAGGERARIKLKHVKGQPRGVLLMAKFDRIFAME